MCVHKRVQTSNENVLEQKTSQLGLAQNGLKHVSDI